MIPPEIIDRIRDSIPLADYISKSVSLKRSGNQLKGCCPFHNERTPSFYIYPSENRFHCFGCGKHGDIFTYMQEIEGHSFVEAVEQLASRSGITIPKNAPRDKHFEQKIMPLIRVNDEAIRYYSHSLNVNPAGKHAYRYLIDRGVHADSITRFELGYALPQWEGFVRALLARSFRPETLQEAGLARPGKQRGALYDYFRDRVIFPIRNEKGNCVAFGGRLLEAGEPKYLNTPENPLFQKRDILYGLSLAKQEIRKADLVYIAEGYLDVIGMHQSGFGNTVAPLGTSFTQEHLQRLKRYTSNYTLIFDGDAAGRKAVFRIARMLMDSGSRVRVVSLPDGIDAFDLCRNNDRNRAGAKLQAAIPLSDFVLNYLYLKISKEGNRGVAGRISSIEDKLRYLALVFEFLEGFSDRSTISLMIKKAAMLTGTDPDAALRDFDSRKPQPRIKNPTTATDTAKFDRQKQVHPVAARDTTFELYLLRLVFLHDDLWSLFLEMLDRGELTLEHSGALYLLQLIRGFRGDGMVPDQAGRLNAVSDQSLALLLQADVQSGRFKEEYLAQFHDTVKNVRLRQLSRRRKLLSRDVNRFVLAGEKQKAMEIEQQILEIRKTEEALLHSDNNKS